MKNILRLLPTALLAFALPLSAAVPSANGGALAGKWSNPKDSVVIDVAPCGAAMCGTVTWASPKAKADAARGGTQRLVGTRLMRDFRPVGPNRWKGSVFLPKHDMTASGTVRMVDNNTILVEGCALAGFVCKSQRWSRVN